MDVWSLLLPWEGGGRRGGRGLSLNYEIMPLRAREEYSVIHCTILLLSGAVSDHQHLINSTDLRRAVTRAQAWVGEGS